MAETKLADWNEVEKTLFQIGCINRVIANAEARMNTAIDQAKKETKKEIDPYLEKKALLELSLKEFCEDRQDEFAKTRTKILFFGSVGFRQSTKVIIKGISQCIEKLKNLGFPGCVRVHEQPDKEAMRELMTAAQLAAVGASLKVDDVFGYEIFQEKVIEKLEAA
jgi:phage host-nuclease inhibitor protein Gam